MKTLVSRVIRQEAGATAVEAGLICIATAIAATLDSVGTMRTEISSSPR